MGFELRQSLPQNHSGSERGLGKDIRRTEAWQIGRHDKYGTGQRLDHVAEVTGRIGQAMQQHERGLVAITRCLEREIDPAGQAHFLKGRVSGMPARPRLSMSCSRVFSFMSEGGSHFQPSVCEQSHVIFHPDIRRALRLLQTFRCFASIIFGSVFNHVPITFPGADGSMNGCTKSHWLAPLKCAHARGSWNHPFVSWFFLVEPGLKKEDTNPVKRGD